ncbi:hypothetical protein [Pseudooceanicola sp.]|uniref:hypothetical protein n=1 Tax=Pseudooceanicola sp. TaxID=1914328 RepID=UPI000C09D436|nr:hypothetical protein [Pseudooceanicola sp.]|tara:strand:+ start:3267 stop:4052 length:786 start_codon:yes stop_codon:yes gene_type:complete
MTFTTTQNATTGGLTFSDDSALDIQPLHDHVVTALAAFGLQPTAAPEMGFDQARIVAGPIAVDIRILNDDEGPRVDIAVSLLRASESLHPEAPTAILAEALSVLIECLGGDLVDWTPDNVTFSAIRFQAAFTPLRQRGGATDRIIPRRIRPGMVAGVPMTEDALIRSMPKDVPLGLQCDRDLKAIFTPDAPVEPEPMPSARRLATWTATASVGIMNPIIGVPLAAYNLIRGEDIRVTSHTFALTATLSGIGASTFGYMPFF